MEPAAKILTVAGTVSIAASFVIGFALAQRRKTGTAEEHRLLLVAHEVALLEGLMMFGLVFAVELGDLSRALESIAAWLIVAAAVFQIASALVNYRSGVRDQFAERSFGLQLATINAVLAAAGIAILLVGVFRGL